MYAFLSVQVASVDSVRPEDGGGYVCTVRGHGQEDLALGVGWLQVGGQSQSWALAVFLGLKK